MSSTWNQFWLVFSLFHPGSISEGYWTRELPVIQSIMVCLQKQILYIIRVLFMKMELLINRVFFRASWYKHYSGNKPYMYFSFQFMLWFPYHHRFKMSLEYRIFSLQLQEYFAAEKLLWAYGKRGILRGLMDIFFFCQRVSFPIWLSTQYPSFHGRGTTASCFKRCLQCSKRVAVYGF